MATVLGIPLNTIRLVNVVAEDRSSPSGRRRRQAESIVRLTLEIGDPPKNQTTLTEQAPPLSEQIADGAPNSATDNVDSDANSTVSNKCREAHCDACICVEKLLQKSVCFM